MRFERRMFWGLLMNGWWMLLAMSVMAATSTPGPSPTWTPTPTPLDGGCDIGISVPQAAPPVFSDRVLITCSGGSWFGSPGGGQPHLGMFRIERVETGEALVFEDEIEGDCSSWPPGMCQFDYEYDWSPGVEAPPGEYRVSWTVYPGGAGAWCEEETDELIIRRLSFDTPTPPPYTPTMTPTPSATVHCDGCDITISDPLADPPLFDESVSISCWGSSWACPYGGGYPHRAGLRIIHVDTGAETLDIFPVDGDCQSSNPVYCSFDFNTAWTPGAWHPAGRYRIEWRIVSTGGDAWCDDGYAETIVTYQPDRAFGVRLDLPSMARPGQTFHVTGYLDNPDDARQDVPVAFVLDVFDRFWFWPSWSYYDGEENLGFDCQRNYVPAGTTVIPVLPEFTWPDTGDEMIDGLYFYGAMLNSSMTAIEGEMAAVMWGYGPE